MNESVKNTQVFLLKRGEFFQILFSALILGLGVNLLATWVSDYIKQFSNSYQVFGLDSTYVLLCIGGVTTLFGLIPSSLLVFGTRRIYADMDACMPIGMDSSMPINLPFYRFSDMFIRTLRACFIENPALRHLWETQPISYKRSSSISKNKEQPEETSQSKVESDDVKFVAVIRKQVTDSTKEESRSASIVREMVEYIIIDKLSMHLSEYFNRHKENTLVREYVRSDIPSLLLDNRILNLLSAPLENRQIFIKCPFYKKKPDDGEIVCIYGSDGSVYSRFDLILPNDIKITRPREGLLRLENKRVKIDINIDYQGYLMNLPDAYPEVILGRERKSLKCFKVGIAIDAQIKRWRLITTTGWKYYQWIDSFIDALNEDINFKKYLSAIGWNSGRIQHIATSKVLARMQKRVTKSIKLNKELTRDSEERNK